MRYQGTETDENGNHPTDKSLCEFDTLGTCVSCGQTIDDTERLAREFAKRIREALTTEDLREVVRLNGTERYQGCCATHDFLDANVVMGDAFEACFGQAPGIVILDNSADTDLWNAAWDMAKAAKFYQGDI